MHLGWKNEMIWDSHSSNMKEPNPNESEQTMGLHISTNEVANLSKNLQRHTLGLVMDLNCLTWILSLRLIEHRHFAQLCPLGEAHPTFIAPTMGQSYWCKGPR
jgi:hypothetical protein